MKMRNRVRFIVLAALLLAVVSRTRLRRVEPVEPPA
jgi:hypothetical protein